jgi:hypothetical protein
MSDTTDRAPWCPRCGSDQDEKQLHAYCERCFFNAYFLDGAGWRSAMLWEPAIRAELARQALEMRAHSAATQNIAHGCSLFTLSETLLMVTNDYEWLAVHPLRLPGEGA